MLDISTFRDHFRAHKCQTPGFYNYARLAGQEEKIRQRLEKQTDGNVEKTGERVVKRERKERVVDPEREARRLQRRAERKARRESKQDEKSE